MDEVRFCLASAIFVQCHSEHCGMKCLQVLKDLFLTCISCEDITIASKSSVVFC